MALSSFLPSFSAGRPRAYSRRRSCHLCAQSHQRAQRCLGGARAQDGTQSLCRTRRYLPQTQTGCHPTLAQDHAHPPHAGRSCRGAPQQRDRRQSHRNTPAWRQVLHPARRYASPKTFALALGERHLPHRAARQRRIRHRKTRLYRACRPGIRRLFSSLG